jgi:ABC-type oligopeptide transport system substrate-binding subunit
VREFLSFMANPAYGSRPSKVGLPRMKEIRFFVSVNPVHDLEVGEVDLALDLTAEQAAELKNRRGFVVPLPGEGTNRRIYFLAVNNSKPALKEPDLRVALARAIDREGLLNRYFRTGLGQKVHKALGGPYPAGSWACNPDLKSRKNPNSFDPFDDDLARAKWKTVQGRIIAKEVRLSLKYPSGDKVLAEAIKALCAQVNGTLVGIQIQPEEVTPHQLRQDVEETLNYDLAYYHYDFPDETFWLMPLLGPGRGDKAARNCFDYRGELVGKIKLSTSLRNFTQVKEYAQAIHRDFLDREMPFIPLWQLDPLFAYRQDERKAVIMPPVDPQLMFTDVEWWQVK